MGSAEFGGTVKPIEEGQVAWVRHLLRDVRTMTLNTGHMSPIYSAVEEMPDGTFRQRWISFAGGEEGGRPTRPTRHSAFIDDWAGFEPTEGWAPVEFLLFDPQSTEVSLTMHAMARRVPLEEADVALAAIERVRERRRLLEPDLHAPVAGRPESPYEAEIMRFTIPVRVFDEQGVHAGEDHLTVPPELLRGFAD